MQVQLSGKVSSQYLTALLMAAPLATGSEGVHIQISDELVSQPYVSMTIKLMERFGVKVSYVTAFVTECKPQFFFPDFVTCHAYTSGVAPSRLATHAAEHP